MTKKGSFRLVFLTLVFFFMILYGMQLTGYNEYNENRRNMITKEELENFEKDIKNREDVSIKEYTRKQKDYNNRFSSFGLSISKGIENVFNDSMNAFFKMMEDAVKKEG